MIYNILLYVMSTHTLETKQNQNNNRNRNSSNQYKTTEVISCCFTNKQTNFATSTNATYNTENVHFGAQRGFCRLNQGLSVLYVNKDTIADLVQVTDSNAGGLLVAVSDPDRVNAAVQQLLGFFQQGASQDCRQDSAQLVQENVKTCTITTN